MAAAHGRVGPDGKREKTPFGLMSVSVNGMANFDEELKCDHDSEVVVLFYGG